jgi:hypothetical protein
MKNLSDLSPSLNGARGGSVSLRANLTHIQYANNTSLSWVNLVGFADTAPNGIRKTGGVFTGNVQFKATMQQLNYLTIADNIATVNLSFGSFFWLNLTDNVTRFDILNIPDETVSFTLFVKQATLNSTASVLWNFNNNGTNIKWPNNTPVTQVSPTSNQIDIFNFVKTGPAAAPIWRASTIGQNFL